MQDLLLIQFVAVALLLISSVAGPRRLPSVERCLESLTALWRTLPRPNLRPRARRVAMRGARAWWE